MFGAGRQGKFAGVMAAALLALTACSGVTPEQATSGQTNSGTGGGPRLSAPYPSATVQQSDPAVAGREVPVVKRIATDRPYVFLTIDDGVTKDPGALKLMQQYGTHPVLFLNQTYVKGHEAYFKRILDATGASLGDHTLDHPNLRGRPYEFQRHQICDNTAALQQGLGVRPTLFRPPYGNYDQNTLRAAATCGMRAMVLWTATVDGGHVQFQAGTKLRPGDIVLMHFRKTFKEDYTAFVKQAKKDGLAPVALLDFLN
jgi:peptidoglycan/xylan/chitin deacetylase (PgdA/CDA1 family)